MPDHDPAPDPMDKAYAEAEAVLSNDSARAERRARVLAAVAREPATPLAAGPPPIRRAAWRRGGWLVAASVAGLSALLTTHLYSPERFRPEPPPSIRAVPDAVASRAADSPPTAAPSPAQPPTLQAVAPQRSTPSPRRVPPAAPPPPQVAQAPEASPAAAPPASAGPSGTVATAHRREAEVDGAAREAMPNADFAAPQALAASQAPKSSAGAPSDGAARLHAAASAGRTAELAALLAAGVPVDALDADGETALMKSIQAGQPTAAAVLRRHGASLDRKDRAGVSARDMATTIDDEALNQALRLDQ